MADASSAVLLARISPCENVRQIKCAGGAFDLPCKFSLILYKNFLPGVSPPAPSYAFHAAGTRAAFATACQMTSAMA